MNEPVIFLDIDGCLNHFDHWEGVPGTSIYPSCVRVLNRIIDEGGAKMVLSSSWRHLILNDAMSLTAFEYMLHSHGVRGSLVGHTCDDAEHDTRGEQIRHWRRVNKHRGRYVIIDDMDDGISERGLNFVRTNPKTGLVDADVKRALEFLTEKK